MFSFPENSLEAIVLAMLNKYGFNKMSEVEQKEFFPQFMAEAERRIGVALLPHLSEEDAKKLA